MVKPSLKQIGLRIAAELLLDVGIGFATVKMK